MAELSYARELYYRGSARTPPGRVILGLVVAMSAAALVGAVYGVLVCQIPRLRDMLLVLGGAAVLLAAFAFGVAGTTTGVLRWTRVRTRAPAYVIAVCAALVAWWGACVAWEYVVLRRLGYSPPLVKLMLPPITWDVARMLNEVGTLSYRNKPLRGNILRILWGVEAAAVLVVGIRFPPRWLSKQAVCEYCRGWCRYKEGFLSIDYGDEDLLRAALENKDLGALEELGPADMDAGRRFRLDLQSCPGCEHAHLLSAFRIDVFENPQDGRRRQTPTLVVDRLWLDAEQVQHLREIKDRLWPPIADVADDDDAPEDESSGTPT